MLADEAGHVSRARASRLLLELVRPQSSQIVLLFVLAVAQTALMAVPPWLVSIAIDFGIPAVGAMNYWPLISLALMVMACAIAAGLLSMLWRHRTGLIGQVVVFDLRVRLFAKFQSLSIRFHDRFSSGRMIARLTSDMESVNTLFGVTLAGLLQAALSVGMVFIAMFLLDVRLAAVAFSLLMPIVILLIWATRRFKDALGQNRAAITAITAHAVETINGIRVAQAYRREGRHDELFGVIAERGRVAGRKIQRTRGINVTLIEMILGLATLVVLVVGGVAVADGTMAVGLLAAFVIYIGQLFPPIYAMASVLDAVQSALLGLGKIAEVLDADIDVAEPKHPSSLPSPAPGEVILDRVNFAYGTSNDTATTAPTISELTLRLAPGEVVAMLGATGAGKSTIAKLIARFYDPTRGRVLLDGVDLRDLKNDVLRGAVVMLTQEGFIFSGSVADNIRIGRPTASDEQVRAAARSVGADSFIDTLPEGYATDVRKRGARLSAGQRQMVAFARAFLADPTVLVLDEATSALDIPTELAMQQALQTLVRGRTALIIAHRLSTIQIADRVIVVADGSIVDDGAPAEMLARGTGEFAELYRDGHGLSLRNTQ